MNSNKSNNPVILDGTFFTIVESNSAGNVTASCRTCSSNIKGSLKTTSNFTTHLQKVHLDKFKEYQEYKTTGVHVKKTKAAPFPVIARSSNAQLKADDLYRIYLVKTMQPVSVVENRYFKGLIDGIIALVRSQSVAHPTPITVPARKTMTTRITDRYEEMKRALTDKLQKVEFVSVTTDIWSAHHKSYLGVTCHWIAWTDVEQEESLTRYSAVLALKRFTGRHTAERITELLGDIFCSFKIQSKITMVTTDNGSNFIKAFQQYGCVFEDEPEEEEDDPTAQEDEDPIVVVTEDATTALDETTFFSSLPPHSRCASHTLSLIATSDLEKELESKIPRQDRTRTTCKQVLRSAMAKCSAYWNKCSRSNLIPEKIKEEILVMPKTPNKTRWNSTFDAVEQLVNNFDKLDRMFELADVAILKSTEKEFLRSYFEAMAPVAWTLDKLQAEKNLYFGAICSALHKCKNKLEAFLGNEEDNYKTLISSALLISLKRRFAPVLDLQLPEAKWEIMAAVSLPFSKLWWIPDAEKERIKCAFIEEAKKYNPVQPMEVPSDISIIAEDDLFDFDVPAPAQISEDAELECIRYFKDTDRKLSSLKSYPRVLKMFFKFNTGLPSSAPSERLFSYGKLILRPQRARLGDSLFEQLAYLKLND